MEASKQDWNEWFARHGPALLLVARGWCDSAADAEEALQDGFVRFWRTRQTARDPQAYLFACVRSAAHDRRRSEQSRQQRERRVGEQRSELREGVLFESGLEQDERKQAIVAALTDLPRDQAEVLTMKIWGELTFAQIGEAIGVSANTAASRYRYGLAALRRTLNEETVR